MSYRQLTTEERSVIAHLGHRRLSPAQIAKQLGRHRSTIKRELDRNSCNDGRYRCSKAQMRARSRRHKAKRDHRKSDQHADVIEEKLIQLWSPEQISGHLANHGITLSHESIYLHIYRDQANGGCLVTYLRQAKKRRRKRYRSKDSRGKAPGKRHITERSLKAELRIEAGHWEGDTVIGTGSTHCIVTLVDRRTGYVLIGKLPARTVTQTNARIAFLLKREERIPVRSITLDNGTEFHGFKELESQLRIKTYFANPYHSWERGTNENTNGLIRQYIPKGVDMRYITQRQLDVIARDLNARPRKRHGYKTPTEVMRRHLKRTVALVA